MKKIFTAFLVLIMQRQLSWLSKYVQPRYGRRHWRRRGRLARQHYWWWQWYEF